MREIVAYYVPVTSAETVQEIDCGDDAGVPNVNDVVVAAGGVLFVDHENVPIVVEALSIARFVFGCP